MHFKNKIFFSVLFYTFCLFFLLPLPAPLRAAVLRQPGHGELWQVAVKEMGQGKQWVGDAVGPQIGGYAGGDYRINREWNMRGNVGEDPEERKGSVAARVLRLAICVPILLGHTNASSVPYGRERLKWFRQVLLRAPHS